MLPAWAEGASPMATGVSQLEGKPQRLEPPPRWHRLAWELELLQASLRCRLRTPGIEDHNDVAVLKAG